ncbi:uncharacterized protein LOC129761194 [Toxorhynchites rutilus septentrionalis]|uniref:uncharacterized protein LOC129761194 n=1 Tax=Toxorhynchites rutilus septentrionalis TaxID=329112 RepID=UPI002478C230|nr:uncharacterized protein LOC129761194 [Toxorhynchites rutilus septentrionalis]
MCGYSDGENLMRLQRCLKGNALEAVRSYLMLPSSVPSIIDTLRTLYGRPDLIISSLLAKIRATPTPKPEKLDTLISFGLACKNLCGHLRAAGLNDYLSNPMLLQELVNKLPANIKLNWSLFKRQQRVVDLTTFGSYMDDIVTAVSDVTFTYEADEHRVSRHEKPKPKEKLYVNAHATDISKPNISIVNHKGVTPKPCPVCQKEGHKAKDCYTFRSMTLNDRWKLAQEQHLCRRCLVSHGKFPCKASTCGENGCEERHHKLLHPGKPLVSQIVEVPKTTSMVTVHRKLQPTILFRILPVTLHGNGKVIDTYAFLDDGSSTTLVESHIAKELGVRGDVNPLCLQWTNDIERTENESQLINLEISGDGHTKRHPLRRIHTVEKMNLPVQSLNYSEISQQFSHLRGLPVRNYKSAVPTILIGLDNSYLKTSLKCREGSRNEPIASKTRLGWTVYGAINAGPDSKVQLQFHICARSPDQELHDLVKDFFALESVGSISPIVESDDDIRAILERTTVRTPTGRFQTGLLWKHDYIQFPNSRPMAERRLQCLERRLASKPELYDKLRGQMKEYQSKEYAYKLSQVELAALDANRTWFLPLNVVINPRKPNKLRLVWDAAAKVQGQSLNSNLLAGPDLLTPLPAVLCPFRQFQVAITADISEMFHQILIQPENRSAQLFLWRDHPSKQFEVFAMKVATFGSTCSPSAAQFIKNRNAQEFSKQFPQAAEAILKHYYVDDFLYSVDTMKEAVQIAQQVKEIHSKAGFHIRNWLSNSSDFLTRVGERNVETSKYFAATKSTTSERVLGMIWKPDPDIFVFQGLFREEMLPLIQGNYIPTKRQTLRIVMSIFDPLGLVAVFVVHGKMLIQNIWRSKIGWDERIPDELVSQWERWLTLLQQLEQIQIPRSYFPGSSSEIYRSFELHIFVDASEEAFAAVAYFRIIEQQTVRCVLVSAKTKVAPLKPISIPRLELMAAVLGVKLAKSVGEYHTLAITRRVFWSDSSTALSWIRSDQRKYRQFVAFRVTEILENSQVDEWRWIPSRWNVADEATKWGKGPSINNSSRWFQAPAYLYQHPDLWPHQDLRVTETPEELRPSTFTIKLVKKQTAGTTNWLNQDELRKAESEIFKQIQQEAYGDEIITLIRNKQLPMEQQLGLEKTSKLRKLSPFLDKHSVIRMDSRASISEYLSTDFKFPVILPKGHYGTQLLINWYHRQLKHRNAETAVNEMRQRFHVSEMRAAFRQVR